MTIKDIARSLGASPTAIGARLSRARSRLREEMIAMMDTAFEGHKLQSSFTFRIVEMVKRIRIAPVPPRVWPWGLSLATGLIIAVLGLGSHLNITDDIDYASSLTSSAGVIKTLKIGELPVDLINVSDITVISSQQLAGDGLGDVFPDMQNALLMAPQAGDTWTKKADIPTPRYQFSASTVNGKIYAIGGYGGWGDKLIYLSTVEEYDPIADSWEKKTNMPMARSGLSTCALNGKIYAMGGGLEGQGIEFKLVEEYDPAIDKWTRKADMLTERQFLSANAVGGKIYAIGGWRVGQAISATEEYDPVTDTWMKKADMPTARYAHSSSVVNGKIYVIGGNTITVDAKNWFPDNGITSMVEEYDPVTDKWTRKADMPTPKMFLSTSAVGGKIYVIGCWTKGGGNLPTVEEYDPLTDKWTEKTDIPAKRFEFASSEVNGKIYIMSGYSSGQLLSTVEEYDTGFKGQSINPKGKLPTTWGEVRTASSK